MESTGKKDLIQISQATADILVLDGKQHWIVEREDAVEVKGKGKLQTYWLNPSLHKRGSRSGSSDEDNSDTGSVSRGLSRVSDEDMVKKHRLVDWITQLLLEHVKKIVSRLGVLK
jgi:Adenylate and Guanylate cyclase catalytic domain